mgnify:CR=1 FL=1
MNRTQILKTISALTILMQMVTAFMLGMQYEKMNHLKKVQQKIRANQDEILEGYRKRSREREEK